jgi:hypothetical protein
MPATLTTIGSFEPSIHLWWRFFWRTSPLLLTGTVLTFIHYGTPHLRLIGLILNWLLLITLQIWLLSGFILRNPFYRKDSLTWFEVVLKKTGAYQTGWHPGVNLWWGVVWRAWFVNTCGLFILSHFTFPDSLMYLPDAVLYLIAQWLSFWWLLSYPMGRYQVTLTTLPTAQAD